ncbi:hypothetical protein [Pseudomonas phage vB_PaeP_YL2]|nr:hypothetical protein [Pseudomonas phage PaVOA]
MEKITWFLRGNPIDVPIDRCLYFLEDGKLVQFAYHNNFGAAIVADVTGLSVSKLYDALKGKFVYVRHGFIVANHRVGIRVERSSHNVPIAVYVKGQEHICVQLTTGTRELMQAQFTGDHVMWSTKIKPGDTLVMLPGEPGERVRKKVVIEEIDTETHYNWCGTKCFEIAVIDKHGCRYTELNDHFQLYGVNKA